MTDMSTDVKVKRLIRKYGVEGYGLYTYILELIVRKLDNDSPMPDLEESSQDIAGDLSMDTLKVEEIMWFCIEQGLFEQDEVTGRVCAHKVYKFLQQSETRSKEIREMIRVYKEKSGTQERLGLSETNVKNRIEENRIEEKGNKKKMSKHEKTGRPISDTRYNTLVTDYGQATVDEYIQKIADWCDAKGKNYKDFAAAAANWIKKDLADGKPLTAPRGGDTIGNIINTKFEKPEE